MRLAIRERAAGIEATPHSSARVWSRGCVAFVTAPGRDTPWAYFPLRGDDNAYSTALGWYTVSAMQMAEAVPCAEGAYQDIFSDVLTELRASANEMTTLNLEYSREGLIECLANDDWSEAESGDVPASLLGACVFASETSPIGVGATERLIARVTVCPPGTTPDIDAVMIDSAANIEPSLGEGEYKIEPDGAARISGAVYEHARLPHLYYATVEIWNEGGDRTHVWVDHFPYGTGIDAAIASDALAKQVAADPVLSTALQSYSTKDSEPEELTV